MGAWFVLRQLLAYWTVLGLPRLHFGNGIPARHEIPHSNVEIVCHAVNLSQHPGPLLAEILDLSEKTVARE